MAEVKPFEEFEMLRLVGSALHKIDTRGLRGTEKVTLEEIVAMAAVIDLTGYGLVCAEVKAQFDAAQNLEETAA